MNKTVLTLIAALVLSIAVPLSATNPCPAPAPNATMATFCINLTNTPGIPPGPTQLATVGLTIPGSQATFTINMSAAAAAAGYVIGDFNFNARTSGGGYIPLDFVSASGPCNTASCLATDPLHGIGGNGPFGKFDYDFTSGYGTKGNFSSNSVTFTVQTHDGSNLSLADFEILSNCGGQSSGSCTKVFFSIHDKNGGNSSQLGGGTSMGPTPEPASALLLGRGFLATGLRRKLFCQ